MRLGAFFQWDSLLQPLTFTSIGFLGFFLAVALLYYLLPFKYSIRNGFLLLASYFFYSLWSPQYAALLGFSTLVSYGGALLTARMVRKGARRAVHIGAVLLNLGVLLVFKYYNFFLSSFGALFGADAASLPLLSLALPLGISYYTFTSLGYQIDVYNGSVAPEKNPITYALFVGFFPAIQMGPIGRAKQMLPQFKQKRKFLALNLQTGAQRFLLGLFKKLVVADSLANVVSAVYKDPAAHSGLTVLLCIALYAVVVYCDFSGYSDMAVGVGRALGFEMAENFAAPYLATNFSGFWKRWHMSLTGWLQDYIFTPLVWSRWFDKLFFRNRLDQKKPHVLANILIVFLISGLWHGASWNFVVWGGLNGLLRIGEELLHRWRKKPKPLKSRALDGLRRAAKRAVVFCLFALTLVFFSTADLAAAGRLFAAAFADFGGLAAVWRFLLGYFELALAPAAGWYAAATIWALLGCVALVALLDYKIERTPPSAYQRLNPLCHLKRLPRWACYYLMLLALLVLGQFGSSSYIYFDF